MGRSGIPAVQRGGKKRLEYALWPSIGHHGATRRRLCRLGAEIWLQRWLQSPAAFTGSNPVDLCRDSSTHGRNLLILGASVAPKSTKVTQKQSSVPSSVPSKFRLKPGQFASKNRDFIPGAGLCAHQTSAPTGKGQRSGPSLRRSYSVFLAVTLGLGVGLPHPQTWNLFSLP
jgi:hypothetical protein